MPMLYVYECEVCGAKSEADSMGSQPAGWFSLNFTPAPGDTAAMPTKYFDKMECLVTYTQQAAKGS
jgi:hypothetical protein